ncbi:hypothetical protein ACOME3_002085 [Neoechinorhynchus agilis]
MHGLPRDTFSAQNATISTRSQRFTYLIDPQSQAVKWLKKFLNEKSIVTVDVRESNLAEIVQDCIEKGLVCLVQNVGDNPPSSLENILIKNVKRKEDGSAYLEIGDKELPYNENFNLYMATKLSNPKLSSDVFSKLTVVNFAVRQDGLKEQLLEILVGAERPDLAEQKIRCAQTMAEKKAEKQILEDEFLRLIEETEGSLLENIEVLNSLENSNRAVLEIARVLKNSQEAEVEIDKARSAYAVLARKAADLFFVLDDFGHIHSMYQFSLDAYHHLVESAIQNSNKSDNPIERIGYITNTLMTTFYRFASNCLFQEHRLLLSFHMSVKLMQGANLMDSEEYGFFVQGSSKQKNIRMETLPSNMFKLWLSDQQWAEICALVRLRRYRPLLGSFTPFADQWNNWYMNPEPENIPIPGGIENNAGNLCRLQLIKIIRPDRLTIALKSFVENTIGKDYIEPVTPSLMTIYQQSSRFTPVLFILSPGADPMNLLKNLASSVEMEDRFFSISLGQGQAEKAMYLLETSTEQGNWVYLANCHLSESWLPKLDKFIDDLQLSGNCHHQFRLWLSSAPIESFPISALQTCTKITTEPPSGIRQNMARIIRTLSRSEVNYIDNNYSLRRLIYPLSFFHSLILERQKFGKVGWNNIYFFNDSDYKVSVRISAELIRIYSEEFPWEALRFMIATVMYGGHVTDEWDMRLLKTYIENHFNESIFQENNRNKNDQYGVPNDGKLNYYMNEIDRLPAIDDALVFGLHPNSEIVSRVSQSKIIVSHLVSLLPPDTTLGIEVNAEKIREDKVYNMTVDILRRLPQRIQARHIRGIDDNQGGQVEPLNIVLYHEVERHNALLATITSTLIDLQHAIRGRIVMTFELQKVFRNIAESKVPSNWKKYYESTKSLNPFIQDMVMRFKQISDWSRNGIPPEPLWISGLSLPGGLLTAIKQRHARQYKIPIDLLSWKFEFLSQKGSEATRVSFRKLDGVILSGFYIEGASWDQKTKSLMDASHQELYQEMPYIRLIPHVAEDKDSKGIYSCPCYYTTNRSTNTFLLAVNLPCGSGFESEHFIKRGTALILNLDD